MAWPALATVASQRARFRFPARVCKPIVALEDMQVGCACQCASLCGVEASERCVFFRSSFFSAGLIVGCLF